MTTKYREFGFPAKYKTMPKSELFNIFINKNILMFKTPALYSKMTLNVLRTAINEKDSNEITWWKLWLKLISIPAKSFKLPYMTYTIDKIYENPSNYTSKELSKLIIQLNEILSIKTNFSLFSTVDSSLNVYSDKSIPDDVMKLYKQRNKIIEILNKNVPKDAIDKSLLKLVIGDYTFNEVKDIETSSVMLEFMYREVLDGEEFKKESVTEVLNHFITLKYKKEHPEIMDSIWKEIKSIWSDDNGKK